MKQQFANFSSMEAGFQGYIDLLETNFPDAFRALLSDDMTVEDFAAGLSNGTMGKYATNPKYSEEIIGMFNRVKRDYIRWHDTNIKHFTNGINFLKRQLGAGFLDVRQQADYYSALQDAFIEREKTVLERDKIEDTQ